MFLLNTRYFGFSSLVLIFLYFWRTRTTRKTIRYNSRLNAEFTKQAMAGQALDGKELLNVRWAHDDPSPKVQII